LFGSGKAELAIRTLAEAGLTNGARVMLIGSKTEEIMTVATAAPVKGAASIAEAKDIEAAKPWSQVPEHKKVIDAGIPTDAPLAYRPGNETLPDAPIAGMLTKGGRQVRVTFKMAEASMVLSTKERTDNFPLGAIRSISSQPIPGCEQYHIVALQHGTTAASTLWLYWFPAQYVAALKTLVAMLTRK